MSSITDTQAFTELGEGLDRAWLIVCGGIVFMMQAGLSLLEAGAVRKKNSNVVWHKLVINSLVTTFTWWIGGYAIAFGDAKGRFAGGLRFWAGSEWDNEHDGLSTQYANWVFQTPVAMAVCAITGGSISERITLKATAIHSFIMTLIIYPFAISWVWGGGWLKESMNYRDYAGCGIVHCTGAYAGLAGLLVIGPRYNKNGNFKDVFKKTEAFSPVSPSSTISPLSPDLLKSEGPMVATSNQDLKNFRKKIIDDEYEEFGMTNPGYTLFGALILWFQFTYFNTGSSIFMKTKADWIVGEKSGVNTFLGGAGGGIFALLFKHYVMHGFTQRKFRFKDEAGSVINAFLAGMVANGSGMDTYEPWEAFVIGLLAGLFYSIGCKIFEKLRLDDALEAFQLHGFCGTLGVHLAAFFNHYDGIFHGNPTGGKVLGYQMFGWLIFSTWSFTISLIVFLSLKKIGWLRVSLKTEIIGYDFIDYADRVVLPMGVLMEEGKDVGGYGIASKGESKTDIGTHKEIGSKNSVDNYDPEKKVVY